MEVISDSTMKPVGVAGAIGGGGGGGGMSVVPVTWVVQALRSGASSVPPAAATRAYIVVWGGRSATVNEVSAVGVMASFSSNISSVLTWIA